MSVRNAKLGGTDFANGEVLYDYDLDDTNNAIINRLPVLKVAGGGVSASTATAVSKITTIPANSITDYIEIKYDMTCNNHGSGGGGSSALSDCQMQISINTTVKLGFSSFGYISNTYGNSIQRKTFVFYYTPSAAEKSTGFTINTEVKYITGGNIAVGGGFTINSINVMGN